MTPQRAKQPDIGICINTPFAFADKDIMSHSLFSCHRFSVNENNQIEVCREHQPFCRRLTQRPSLMLTSVKCTIKKKLCVP